VIPRGTSSASSGTGPATRLDRARWAEKVADLRGLLGVPLVDHDVDALQLRGRSIAAEFRLRLEHARAGHLGVFDATGFDHPRPGAGQRTVR
jgi:hypothetical protein